MKHVYTLFIFAFIRGASVAQTPSPDIVNGLDALFQSHVNQTAGLVPGHVIRIEKPGAWVYERAAGLSCVSPAQAAEPSMKFKVASITKLFTTVAIFKLIQNGLVKFNEPIGTYLPLSVIQGFDDYQNITVKSLLSHRSGIDEPQSNFQGRLNYWIYMKRFEQIPLDSLIFWSYGSPRGLGTYYYSNANFYLLAEIIRSVTGTSYQNYITSSIITPLGLNNTDFNTIPTGNFLRGYLKGSLYPIGGVLNGGLKSDSLYDFTEASNSWGYGAADIWSNTPDLITFHKALFNGQLINKNWVDTMKTLVTNTGDLGAYGYGMIQFKSYNGGPVYGFGHTGSAFGYGSMLCYIPSLDVYMSSAGNYIKIGQEFLQRDIYNFLNSKLASLSEKSNENDFHVYPNPTTDRFMIETSFVDYELTVYNCMGQLLYNELNSTSIDIGHLPSGIYTICLKPKNGVPMQQRLIKN